MIAALRRLFHRAPRLTVAGRLPVVSTHEELDALIAARHAKGDASRKGWATRRKELAR